MARPAAPFLWFAVLAPSSAVPARAQDFDPLSELRTRVAPTSLSSAIRVQLADSRLVTGVLLDTIANGITIALPTGLRTDIPYMDIVRFWERRRSVRAGAARGGILGAIAGAAFGALLSAACEYDCQGVGGAMFQGAVYVGAAGAAAGGLLGAAVPRWDLRWSRPNATPGPTPVQAPPIEAGRSGTEAGVGAVGQIGEVTFPARERVRRLTRFRRRIPRLGRGAWRDGGCLGYARLSCGAIRARPELVVLGGSPGVLTLSGVTRLDLARSRVTAGIGGYAWQGSASAQDVLLTLSAGFGLTFGDGRWRGEARWHPVVHNAGTSYEPTLVTIGAGRRVVW